MPVSQALKVTLLLQNAADSRGVAAEKHFVNYPGSDQAARTLMGQLAEKRALLLAGGSQVREARGEVVGFDANGSPTRQYQLGSRGVVTGGYPASFFPFTDAIANLSPGRNSGPTAVLSYGPSISANFRYLCVAYAPAAVSRDLVVWDDAAKVAAQSGYGDWVKKFNAFYAALKAAGAFQVVRLEPGAKSRIIAVTSGSRQPPTLATVVLAGDQTGPYLAVPKTAVQIMNRRARRGLGTSKYRELNGIHGLMNAEYDSNSGFTTLTLTCTLDTQTDLCRTPGFARPVQWTQLALTDYDVYAAVRGRRSRKNTVQV